jgi:hypothetical protein
MIQATGCGTELVREIRDALMGLSSDNSVMLADA